MSIHKTLSLKFLPALAFMSIIPSFPKAQIAIDMPRAPEPTILESGIKLNVPFTAQIPDGKWVLPYKEACEESSIVMIDEYYAGNIGKIVKKEAKQKMQPYFDYEDAKYGTNEDSNSYRTNEIIANMADNFYGTVIENPTLEEIKAELQKGRPVISFHHGYSLKNAQVPFANSPSSFHVIVLVGYDDLKQSFYAHEPAMPEGAFYAYSYKIIMASLKDYVHETERTEGPPRVIFTAMKERAINI